MSGSRILLVEDEAVVALDIRNRLNSLGYEVVGTVASGEEAVNVAGSLFPDLILMDIMLEGEMDGVEAAAAIKDKHNIAIIYLTAYADADTLQRAKITEPFGYIIKPFEDRELSTTIEMALYKFRMESQVISSERWLSTTLRSIGEGVVTVDENNRIRFMNPVAETILGIDQGQVEGADLGEAFVIEETPGEQAAPVRDLSGNIYTFSKNGKILVRPDGRRVPIETNASPIVDEKGVARGTVIVFRDVSYRRKTEQALRETLSNLRDTLEQTVNALAVTSEKRDPYTAGHQERVSKLATAIADFLGLAEDVKEGIRVAGLLHDIGKIYVPAEILSKPAALTTMEMGIMKGHSEVGFDILKDISFPWPVARIVREHHERLDGGGYPSGLSGEDILLESRILCVADVVEAMSSHRPYRPALGLEKALDEISLNRGRLYDGRVVDACLALFRDKGFRFDE
jgi:PAS domain S-box-containing protein/putative nucleotidyltransferase with HDIG domain